MLRKSFKILHFIGLALFLGSVFGHVATSALGGAAGGSAEFIAARENISALTSMLTLPGLGLTVASGLAMALVGRVNPIRARWLGLHGALAAAVVVLTAAFVAPAGRRVLEDALLLNSGGASLAEIQSGLTSEHVFGALSIVLSLLAIGVAVWRPRLTSGRG